MSMTENERERSRRLHEKMLLENPLYRKEWEKVLALFFTLFADADLPDDIVNQQSTEKP
jgi:hypothetical protein